MLLIFGFSLIGGTLIWLIWEFTIPYMFPKAVESGYIVADPAWWKCVLFSWFCGLTFKGTSSSSSSDD